MILFSYFSMKIGFDISCKLLPQETICMKWHSLFSGKIRKNILDCCLQKFLLSMQCIKLNNKLMILFSYFSMKIGFDISCKLLPQETICMKWHSLFSGKIRKNILDCCLQKFLFSMQRIKLSFYMS